MNWMKFLEDRIATSCMPMGELFAFELTAARKGYIEARATPSTTHYNPFRVVQGGFAASVLDMALGLVSISVLPSDASGTSTIELSVRYLRAIREAGESMIVSASVLHAGATLVVAEANLADQAGVAFATAHSSIIISRSMAKATRPKRRLNSSKRKR
jgi:uncharacterized protein (TIGR00369 family)